MLANHNASAWVPGPFLKNTWNYRWTFNYKMMLSMEVYLQCLNSNGRRGAQFVDCQLAGGHTYTRTSQGLCVHDALIVLWLTLTEFLSGRQLLSFSLGRLLLRTYNIDRNRRVVYKICTDTSENKPKGIFYNLKMNFIKISHVAALTLSVFRGLDYRISPSLVVAPKSVIK